MTIYGLSTGQGRSGIAIIRVSGKEAGNVIKSLTGMKLPVPKLATLRKINYINTSELIDEGIILWFPGPHSYTGEDMAEFQVHGSQSVIKAIHRSISEVDNCRLAEPGEFTKLAFLNGKINLLKAESIGDLISSETEIQRKQAIKIMEGRTSKVFSKIREKLLKILSHIEAKIDFPDEDLPNDILEKIKKTSKEITSTIAKILDDGKVGERIREGFKIAIVGPPNSGKSSLMNNLSRREVAIVSEFAGTTRDVIETHLNIDGYPIIISDTAGVRKSKNEIEQKGIKLALKNAEAADLRLVVIEPKTLDFTGFLKDLFDENSILVINKSDLGYVKLSRQIEQMNHVVISSFKINLFFNLFFIFKINFSIFKLSLIEIKTCSYFFIFKFNFPLIKSDLLMTNIAFSSIKSFKTPLKSILLASTTMSFKSASSALFNANLIPFFSISFFESLIPAVSDSTTGNPSMFK